MKLFNLIDNKERKLQYMDICLIEKVKPIVFAIKSFVYIYDTGFRLYCFYCCKLYYCFSFTI